MRKVFTRIFFLFLLSVCSASANVYDLNILQSIKFQPIPTATPLSKEDIKICEGRARLGAYALHNIRKGVEVESILSDWDEVSLSPEAKDLSVEEILIIRQIIALSQKFAIKYPTVDTNRYGDWIFFNCQKEKQFPPAQHQ